MVIGEIKVVKTKSGTRKYVLDACIDCGYERWVRTVRGLLTNQRCKPCSKRGKLNPMFGIR